jgi:hypothetical protein
MHPISGAGMEYRQLIQDDAMSKIWLRSDANKFGRLAQGADNHIEGSNNINFITRNVMPQCKTVTYGRVVVDMHPNMSEVHRVCLVAGGNLIQYHGDVATRAANLTTSKCIWNSTISTDGAKYMCLDANNFYMGTPMEEFECMHIPIKLFPVNIIEKNDQL